jgi:hypothetical protein
MIEDTENSISDSKVAPAENEPPRQTAEDATALEEQNDLTAPRWSVIGANDRTVRHLTYEEAVECRNVLDSEGIYGLVIVTDETAERLLNHQVQA